MPKAKKTKLEVENELLQQKVAELEKMNVQTPAQDDMSKYMNELKDIRTKGRVESNTIVVQEFTDHKNISLWTKTGKRIGPMHPHNARKSFEKWWNKGIHLSATQPTQEEIDTYKKTKEYKKELAEHQLKRDIKNNSRKKGTMEKYLKQIAEQTGKSADQLNRISNPQDMGSLVQGQIEAGVR